MTLQTQNYLIVTGDKKELTKFDNKFKELSGITQISNERQLGEAYSLQNFIKVSNSKKMFEMWGSYDVYMVNTTPINPSIDFTNKEIYDKIQNESNLSQNEDIYIYYFITKGSVPHLAINEMSRQFPNLIFKEIYAIESEQTGLFAVKNDTTLKLQTYRKDQPEELRYFKLKHYFEQYTQCSKCKGLVTQHEVRYSGCPHCGKHSIAYSLKNKHNKLTKGRYE